MLAALAHRGSHTAARLLRTPSSHRAHRWLSSCPYATLGLQPGASAVEIKQEYLKLAKQVHPDVGGWASGTGAARGGAGRAGAVREISQAGDGEKGDDKVGQGASVGGSGGRVDMARLNAAYEELTHPQRRKAAQSSPQRRRDATAAATALTAAGRTGQAVMAFFSCEDEAPVHGLRAAASDASSAGRVRRETCGRGLFLASCAPGGGGPHGAPTHAQLSQLWLWLGERALIDADVCNGWFGVCMRAGRSKAAVEAYRLAERENLEQGSQMRAYIRQVKSYKAAQLAREAGGGGESG